MKPFLINSGVLALALLVCAVAPAQSPDPMVKGIYPYISSLSPASAEHGGPAFTLTVEGGFRGSSSYVEWNGVPQPTTYVSSQVVTAKISASEIAKSGTASVVVVGPGVPVTNAVTFTIH